MRILVVGWGIEPGISGGMDIHACRVAENLAASGHEVHFFVPGFNAHGSLDKVALHKMDIGRMPEDLQGMISSIKAYNRGIFASAKKLDFDAIHTHDWLGAEVGLKLKESGKKWIHTVHSLEHMRSGTHAGAKSPITRLEKAAVGSADVLLTVSKLMQKEISAMYCRAAEVVYNAPSIAETPAPVEREGNRIFFAGRLAEQKGLKYLIYSMRSVVKAHPSAKLIIAGTGHLRESIEEFAKSLGLGNSVEFLGFVPREKLIGEYQRATLFVSPSIFEPFGITLLDAAVLGAPIVATEKTGALEVFGNDSVSVCKPEDSRELAGKIVALLADGNQRAGMAERAKKDTEKIMGWRNITKNVESSYLKSM